MTTLSIPVAAIGLQSKAVPEVDIRYASENDLSFKPNWQVLAQLLNPIKAPIVTIKKVRKLQRDRTAEEDY